MASRTLTDKLSDLIKKAGDSRKAEILIKNHKGVSPTHSALFKTAKGSGTTDYVATCYIDDLEKALLARGNADAN